MFSPHSTAACYALEFSGGRLEVVGDGVPQFTIAVPDRSKLHGFLRKDPYSAALAYLRGEISIRGDLVSAVRFYGAASHARTAQWVATQIARLRNSKLVSWLRDGRTATDIRFHYDRSNEFYAQFLDKRMVYSCAYFRHPGDTLEEAQRAKLEHVCRKLDLSPGDRLLDIGSGWGSLLLHAAREHGARAVGYTLSHEQAQYAAAAARNLGLNSSVEVHEADYRKARGPFSKISSIGMFEHVGKHHLEEYFRRAYQLLAPDGLFLNHGIVRPDGVEMGAETLFLERRVFPGANLVSLADVVRAAGKVGFQVHDVENLSPHYALTCRAWVDRLQEKQARCREIVGDETYRTWLLYLAGSAANFEDGYSEVHQVLMSKRGGCARRRLTRDFLYADSVR